MAMFCVAGAIAQVRIAEKLVGLRPGIRKAVERGNAAVRRPIVMEIFVGQLHLGERRGEPRQRRIDAAALHVRVVAIAVGVLEHGVDAAVDVVGDLAADVGGHARVVVGPGLHLPFVDRNAIGFLEHAVEHAAAAAAAEDHRVRAFEKLEPLGVVKIAIDLRVVAHAVDEEVGGRALAADDDLVAVAFALVPVDARARNAPRPRSAARRCPGPAAW